MKKSLVLAAAFALAACGGESPPAPETTSAAESAAPAMEPKPETSPAPSLAAVLDAQPDEVKARYQYRNPEETLEFFGVEPGMTVVEALPGGGWYSKVLLPYLGDSGTLIGADYPLELWPNFSFMSEEALEAKKTWVADWTAQAETWRRRRRCWSGGVSDGGSTRIDGRHGGCRSVHPGVAQLGALRTGRRFPDGGD